jgi:hypothetical protein
MPHLTRVLRSGIRLTASKLDQVLHAQMGDSSCATMARSGADRDGLTTIGTMLILTTSPA